MQCVPVYLDVHQCVPVYLDVHQCVPVYLHVHQYVPVYIISKSRCTNTYTLQRSNYATIEMMDGCGSGYARIIYKYWCGLGVLGL